MGLNVKVAGMIVEIQLALKHLAELKTCMHPFYKMGRAATHQDVVSQAIFSSPHDVKFSAPCSVDASSPMRTAQVTPMPDSTQQDKSQSPRRRTPLECAEET